MKKLWAFAFVLACTGDASAGKLFIGLMPSQHAEGRLCHMVEILGPTDAVRQYKARQAERFEPIDNATVSRLKTTVLVTANLSERDDVNCVRNPAAPEKLVLTEKGSLVPLLAIALKSAPGTTSNLAGAFDSAGQAAAAKFEPLRGRELELHLVYPDRTWRDVWRSHYAAEVLRASAP